MPHSFAFGKNLERYLTGVVLLATTLGFLGYAAAISYAAYYKIEGIDPIKYGTHAFFLSGGLGTLGAFLLLLLEG